MNSMVLQHVCFGRERLCGRAWCVGVWVLQVGSSECRCLCYCCEQRHNGGDCCAELLAWLLTGASTAVCYPPLHDGMTVFRQPYCQHIVLCFAIYNLLFPAL
jgi:hypothetical protein